MKRRLGVMRVRCGGDAKVARQAIGDDFWLDGDGLRQQPRQAYHVVRGGDQVARKLGACQAAVARAPEAADRLQPAKDFLNGLFTNDKFCWSRPAKLRLKARRGAYRDRWSDVYRDWWSAGSSLRC